MLNLLGAVFIAILIMLTIISLVTGLFGVVAGSIFSAMKNACKQLFTAHNICNDSPGKKLTLMTSTCQTCEKQMVYLEDEADNMNLHKVIIDGDVSYICHDCYTAIKDLWSAEKNGTVNMSDSLRKLADALMQPVTDKKPTTRRK